MALEGAEAAGSADPRGGRGIQTFRRSKGLMRGANAPISSERLTSIGQQLSQAEARGPRPRRGCRKSNRSRRAVRPTRRRCCRAGASPT